MCYVKVEVTQWISSKHNMGMAINRELWDKFLQCSSHFCQVSHALVAIAMHSIDIAINREFFGKVPTEE